MRTPLTLIIFSLLVSLSFGQENQVVNPPGDKFFGEEEQIKARDLWFVQSRGLDSVFRPDLNYRSALSNLKSENVRRGVGPLWQEVGPSPMTMLNWAMGKVAGRVSCFTYDPDDVNILYLGTASGGVWKSVNGGQTWKPIFDKVGTQTIGSIYVSPAPNKKVWVGTGEQGRSCTSYFGIGVWVSDNEGDTFVEANGSGANRLDSSTVTAIVGNVNDENLLLAGSEGFCVNGSSNGGGVFRTTDGGQNWTMVLPGRITDIANHPSTPNIYFASVSRGGNANGGLYRSTDFGQNWTRLENGIISGTGYRRSRIAIAPSDANTIYALVNRGSVYIYKSTDGGDSWNTQNTNACDGQCSYNLCISVHPTDPNTILVGFLLHYRSTNSGSTLVPMTSGWGQGQTVHQDTHVVHYDKGGTGRPADPNRYWVGSDGGLWVTENSGSDYQHLNEGLNITQFYDVEVHPENQNMIFGGSQDNSSSRGDNDTEWNVTIVTGDGFMNAVDPNNTNIVYQNSYPFNNLPSIARSTSGGAPNTFNFISTTGITAGAFPWVTPMDLTYDGTNSALFVGSDRIYRSTNTGNNWSLISGDISNSSINIINSELIQDKVVIYAGTQDGRIHRTLDAMTANPTFTEVTGNYPGGNVSDVAMDPSNADRAFATRAAFGLNKLYRTTDGGTSWDPIGTGLPDVPANTVVIDPRDTNRIFVGTDIGVYISTDSGDNFASFNGGMPLGSVVTDLEVDDTPYTLTAGTYGRGAWQITLAAPLSVSSEPKLGCSGSSLALTGEVNGGIGPFTYTWSIISGPDMSAAQFDDPTSQNPNFTPTTTGAYVLEFQASDSSNANRSVSVEVDVYDQTSYPLQQISTWLANPQNPSWRNGFDHNQDGVINISDLILENNNPTCSGL